MKKHYELPEFEVRAFTVEDVITTSLALDDNETEPGGGL